MIKNYNSLSNISNLYSDFTVIIVLYNSASLIVQNFLNLFNHFSDVNFILIDNGSDDLEELLKVVDTYKNVKFIKLDKNYGFSAAANQAYISSNSRWSIFINPDVYIDNENFKNALINTSKLNDEIVYGTILSKTINGEIDENYHLKVSTLRLIFEPILKLLLKCSGYQLKYSQNLHYIDGSFLIIRSSIFDKVEGFSNFFIYGEDSEINKRINEIGLLKSFYFNKIFYYHNRSMSCSKMPRDYNKVFNIEYSKYFLLYKYSSKFNRVVYFLVDLIISIIRLFYSLLFDRKKIKYSINKLNFIFLISKSILSNNIYIQEYHSISYEQIKKNNLY